MFRSERQNDLPEIPQSASGPDLISKSEQDTRAPNLPSGVRMMSFLDSVSTGVCSGWPLSGLLLSYHWQTVFWARRGGQGVILVEGPENMRGSHGCAGSARSLGCTFAALLWLDSHLYNLHFSVSGYLMW